MTRSVLSRLVPPGMTPSAAHDGERDDVGDERLRAGTADLVAGDPAPDRHEPVLRVVDRLAADPAGGEPTFEVSKNDPASSTSNGSAISALVGCGHLRHLDERGGVTARSHGVRTQRREHRPGRRPSPTTCAWVVARPCAAIATVRSTTSSGGGDPMNWVVIHCSGRSVALLRRLDRRGDPAAAVQESERCARSLRAHESEAVRILGRLQIEQVERGQHRETIPESPATANRLYAGV